MAVFPVALKYPIFNRYTTLSNGLSHVWWFGQHQRFGAATMGAGSPWTNLVNRTTSIETTDDDTLTPNIFTGQGENGFGQGVVASLGYGGNGWVGSTTAKQWWPDTIGYTVGALFTQYADIGSDCVWGIDNQARLAGYSEGRYYFFGSSAGAILSDGGQIPDIDCNIICRAVPEVGGTMSLDMWSHGRKLTTNASTGFTPNTDVDLFFVGNQTAAGWSNERVWQKPINYICIWERDLTDDEIRIWAADPFCMFRYDVMDFLPSWVAAAEEAGVLLVMPEQLGLRQLQPLNLW